MMNKLQAGKECEILFREFESTASLCMSPEEAVTCIRSCDISNRFITKLTEFYPHDDLRARLSEAFLECDPSSNPRSVDKRIANWINGLNMPSSREDIFIIAFALNLNEEQTSSLLGICDDSCIHYRNGKELTYAFGLRMGYSYEETNELFAELPPRDGSLPPTQDFRSVYTLGFKDTFLDSVDRREFIEKYSSHINEMGQHHNNAYKYFEKYLSVLATPEQGASPYSAETIIDMYLSPRSDTGKNRKSLDCIQKFVRKNWPNATELKNIRLRKSDVPRKVLLLLYIATENVFFDDAGDHWDEDLDNRELFEERWWDINLMLDDCGMPVLNPENPFDWLIVYSIYLSDEDESMYDRLCSVIDVLYLNEDPAKTV